MRLETYRGPNEITFCERLIRSSDLSSENTCMWHLEGGGSLHCIVVAIVIDITVCIICM
jgi:hypothetical protein